MIASLSTIKNFLKTIIKSHGDEAKDFYDKNIPKVVSNHTCLVVISLDSALKKDDKYYQQLFIRECKYIEEKVIRYINDNLSRFSFSDELVKNKLEWVKFFCKSIAT